MISKYFSLLLLSIFVVILFFTNPSSEKLKSSFESSFLADLKKSDILYSSLDSTKKEIDSGTDSLKLVLDIHRINVEDLKKYQRNKLDIDTLNKNFFHSKFVFTKKLDFLFFSILKYQNLMRPQDLGLIDNELGYNKIEGGKESTVCIGILNLVIPIYREDILDDFDWWFRYEYKKIMKMHIRLAEEALKKMKK